MDKDKLAKAKERALSVPLELMRFVPLLYEIIEDQLDGKLSTGFKWVKEPISQSFFPKVSSKVKSYVHISPYRNASQFL